MGKPGTTTTSHSDDRLPSGSQGMAGAAAPRGLRRAFGLLLAALAVGALYLIATRRDAILIDLANFTAWCF